MATMKDNQRLIKEADFFNLYCDYDHALERYLEALEINPHDQDTCSKAVSILLAQHRYAECIPLLKQSLSLYPDNAYTYFLLATSYYYTSKFIEASIIVQDAIERFSQKPPCPEFIPESRKLLERVQSNFNKGYIS